MTWFIGIDPGKSGAICAITTDGLICFEDINQPGHEIYSVLVNSQPLYIILEKVTPMQKGGLVSAWRFGQSVGRIQGILEATGLGYDTAPPKEWQKATGVVIPPKTLPAQRKRITEARVKQLYPKAEIYGPKGGLLDGRADALMIAHYCMLKYK